MLLEHLLFVAMLMVFPVWDHFETRRLKTTTDPRAKLHSYWKMLAVQWSMIGLLLITRGPQQLFFLEDAGTLPWELSQSSTGRMAMGALTGIVVPVVIALLIPAVRARLAKLLAPLMFVLPQTRIERRWWVAVCLTAGICEEIIYRGFLIQYFVDLPLGLSLTTALLLSCAVFGLGHLYQGPVGMLEASLFAGFAGVLFLATGNLLLPMIIHTLVDLRILAILAPSDTEPTSASGTLSA